jgi:TonB family protein
MTKAAPVVYPASANLLANDMVVRIDVTVGKDGSVQGVVVVRSSGHQDADDAALAAARASRYQPATKLCAATAGHYAFTTTFVAPVTRSSGLPPAP